MRTLTQQREVSTLLGSHSQALHWTRCPSSDRDPERRGPSTLWLTGGQTTASMNNCSLNNRS